MPPSSLALATPQGGRPPTDRQSRFRGGKLEGAAWRLARGWATLLTALLLGLLTQPALAAFGLVEVTALLAQNKSGEARFTEERYVSNIDGPLRAAGTLSFQAPDRFTRTTTEPRGEAMEVQGNTLLLKRGGRTRQTTVDAIPELSALIEAVRGTLTGNAVLLDRFFKTQVEGQAARWTLTLVPRDARLATQVREVKITGLQGEVRSIELWLAGGDRSVMAIDPLQPLQAVQTPALPAAGKASK